VFETGNEATRLQLRRIAEPSEEPARVTLPVHLVRRVSCGAAGAAPSVERPTGSTKEA
jgi:hypothetical protein